MWKVKCKCVGLRQGAFPPTKPIVFRWFQSRFWSHFQRTGLEVCAEVFRKVNPQEGLNIMTISLKSKLHIRSTGAKIIQTDRCQWIARSVRCSMVSYFQNVSRRHHGFRIDEFLKKVMQIAPAKFYPEKE